MAGLGLAVGASGLNVSSRLIICSTGNSEHFGYMAPQELPNDKIYEIILAAIYYASQHHHNLLMRLANSG